MRICQEGTTNRPPLEILEKIGGVIVVGETVVEHIATILKYQALGCCDVVMFATDSAKVQIGHNEAFFKLPFLVAGDSACHQLHALIRDADQRLHTEVEKGLVLAERARHTVQYDQSWPQTHGLERLLEIE